ncbi:MAG: tetratricopeptide repeat protein [Deltaproteobacteria bacterium]|nr:tetratricopeptide repeat protein [Deltaproteobacteria bacterium]
MENTRQPRRVRWVLALVLLLTGLTFAPSLSSGFVWDDVALIQENRYIRDFSYLGRNLSTSFWDVGLIDDETIADQMANVYYRPLVTISFMIDHALFGAAPWGYHLTNLLLHLLSVWLFLLVIRRVLALAGVAQPTWPLLVGSLVFALHPTRAESVCWVSGRSDVMMAAFFFGALLLFWRALTVERRALLILGGWGCFLLAVLCKETAIALVVVLLALDVLVLSRGDRAQRRRNALTVHLPLWLITAVFVALRLALQSGRLEGRSALGPFGWLNQLLATISHYGRLLVDPFHPNAMIAPYFNAKQPYWPGLIAGPLAIVAVVGLGYFAYRRKQPLVVWAMIAFVAALAPALNIVPLSLNMLVAERFLYLPLFGVALLVALGIAASHKARFRALITGASLTFCLLWGITNVVRAADFSSPARFWQATLAADPTNPLPRIEVGKFLVKQGNYRQAEHNLVQGFRHYQRVGVKRSYLLETSLMLVDVHLLRTLDAEAWLTQASRFLAELVAIADGERNERRVAIDLGSLKLRLNIDTPRSLKALRSKLPLILPMLGNTYSRLGQGRKAVAALRRALKHSDRTETRFNLAIALAREGEVGAARQVLRDVRPTTESLQEADRIRGVLARVAPRAALLARPQVDPAVAARARGEIQVMLNTPGRAAAAFAELVALRPDDRQAHLLLAMSWAGAGRLDKAIGVIDQARAAFGDDGGLAALEQRVRAAYQRALAKAQR